MKHDQLKGVRVAVLAADGFEQVEVTWLQRALERAGADVRIISLRPGRIRGMNFIWHGRKLAVDDVVFDARPEDYGALYLPGGFVSPDLLRQSQRVQDFVRGFEATGRPIAAICHGPALLISSGLVRGRTLASWPGIADDVRNAGGNWQDQPVVHDGNWISSRGPHDMAQFIPAVIAHFADKAARAQSGLPRRMRWGAVVSRLGAAGALAGAFFGARAIWRRRRA